MTPARTQQALPDPACPACERYTGMSVACPYCGLDTPHGTVLKRLRCAAIIVAGAGLLFLYLAAKSGQGRSMRIGDLNPHMDGATIRVAGRVATQPYVWPPNGPPAYVSFLLEDRTGVLGVSASRPLAGQLAAAGFLPQRGETVRVTGCLRVEPTGKRRLRIHNVEGLSLVPVH